MLTNLSIRNVVLIDKLDVEFGFGLTVLTGETGAGKSIILDSLALSLGARSEKGLVRTGADFGSVSARFEPPPGHAAFAILETQGISPDGEIVLRRQIRPDGRSRSYVNGETVSATFLRELGKVLVEVHGQMDQQGLMDSRTHTRLLDLVGQHEALLQAVNVSFEEVQEKRRDWKKAAADAERAKGETEYLEHRLGELTSLAPAPGEEARLTLERQQLQNRGKILAILNECDAVLNGDGGVIEKLGSIERRFERFGEPLRESLIEGMGCLNRALIELGEASEFVISTQAEIDQDPQKLDQIEDRLFALKDAARKHRIEPDQLPHLLKETQRLLDNLQSNEDLVRRLERNLNETRSKYQQQALVLSHKRQLTADQLEKSISAEFAPLKLDRARFRVRFEKQDPSQYGNERAVFEISTNPGQDFGALGKIASGGELSRLMLALKVVLARTQTTHSMVFDEVDSGVGGATAAAVGDRLARLAENQQVLVVTHAPQVAARADHHFVVSKVAGQSSTNVHLTALAEGERMDELARMISGETVTSEAKAAAVKLLARELA